MSSLLSEIHFWTTQEDVITKTSYYGAFKYYSKKEFSDPNNKKGYCEQRGLLWNPINNRQNKLKDRLKELEDSLIQNKIIYYLWKDNTLHLLLSTGLIVFIKTNELTGDIIDISYDKQLSSKLQVNIICDGVILNSQVICICNDGHVIGYGGVWKEGWLLEGGPRRRINAHGDWLVVWGRPGSEHPQPWSPLTRDHQRANLHVYYLGLSSPELLAYKNTDGEPLIAIISKVVEQTIILVEQKVTQRGAVSVEVSTLGLTGNSLKTIAITAVPLQTQVSCCQISPDEKYLLICCIDNTLALLDREKGSTKTVKASFIPTLCVWQKLGALAAICNKRGQIQYYDIALNSVKTQILSEEDIPSPSLDLTSYFHSQISVISLNWDNTHLIVALEQGPLVCITHIPNSLSFISLAKKYIDMSEMKKAISLLLSWSFGEDSFFILQKIVSYLLKKSITEEIAHQLQDALGCYHASLVPLSPEIRNQFGNQVFSLTRRFFHRLIRAGMYETAFLLAVDIVHHDLFMDLHYIAVKIGETEMAAAARAQASALVSRCSSEASNCPHSSCSDCSSSGDETKEKESYIDRRNVAISDTSNDNLLSTNFNQPEMAKTYIVPSGAYEFSKLNPPRVNYVKPPQVPAKFSSKSLTATSIPPLQFNFSPLNCNLGIPLIGSNHSNHSQDNRVPFNSNAPLKPTNLPNLTNNLANVSKYIIDLPSSAENSQLNFVQNNQSIKHLINVEENTNSINYGKSTTPMNFGENIHLSNFDEEKNVSNIAVENIQSNFVRNAQPRCRLSPNMNKYQNYRNLISNKPIFSSVPSLNMTNTSNSTISPVLSSQVSQIPFSKTDVSSSSSSISLKKPQSKVKFSDTVTAFIVPEIKRPTRPAPLPHVTDPQRELADSLPLCHPNDEYLKDFALTPQDENIGGNKEPPKIKVVHFGVV